MKTLGLALAASLVSFAALAQTTTTVTRTEGPDGDRTVTRRETVDGPAVTTRRSIETTGSVGCSTRSVTRTDEDGDTTTKTRTDC